MRALMVTVVLAIAAPALADVTLPSFVEETKTSGIDSSYEGEWEYMVGGGVATFDCNGDQFPDMYLAGGLAPAKFYLNRSRRGGELKFEEYKSGLELDKVTGAYPVDIDSDGKTDIVVLRVGENVVMKGLGDCRFERATEAWGFDGGDAWSVAFAATWEKGNAWPTLAVGNYVNRLEEMSPWGSCTDNWLHRPDAAAGKFAAPLPLKPSYCPLSMMFSDWNRSGTPSLRMSNDREYYEGGQEQMWKLEPGKPPELYTEAEGWKYLRIWGMGIASYDVDDDGYPEYYLSSMADHKLQTLASVPKDGMPKPGYKDVAYPKGLTAHRPYIGDDLKPSTGWHTQFEDVNNDGLIDLFVAKGNVAEMPDFAMKDPNNLLVQQPEGKFIEAGGTSGVGSGAVSRGAAMSDFNLDGLVDLVVVNRWQTAQLWRNTTASGNHWIGVKLVQPGSNRDAIGAWIEVKNGERVLRREVLAGGGHASGQSGFWHFGLGTTAEAELRVIWPGGTVGDWQTLSADSFYSVEPGKAASPIELK